MITEYPKELNAERLRKALSYDPAARAFYWREKRGHYVEAGDRAGSQFTDYELISIDGLRYTVRSLIWFHQLGEGKWPSVAALGAANAAAKAAAADAIATAKADAVAAGDKAFSDQMEAYLEKRA